MNDAKNKKALIALVAVIVVICIFAGAFLTTLIGNKIFSKNEAPTEIQAVETTVKSGEAEDIPSEEELTADNVTDIYDYNRNSPHMAEKRLDITDEEIQQLADFINEKMGISEVRLDTSADWIIVSQIIRADYGVIGTYDLYFPQPPCYIPDYDSVPDIYKKYYMSEYKEDPLRKYECYTVIPEKEIIWMCENIYNRNYKPLEDDLAEYGYLYEGDYYILIGDNSAPNPEVTLSKKNKDSNGIYYLTFELNYGEDKAAEYISITMDIRMIDGRRCMTFYDIYPATNP